MSYWKVIGLGWLAGMRSVIPLAVLSHRLADEKAAQRLGAPWKFLAYPAIATLLKVAALGEMVADKTPQIPARTSPLALGGRIGMGALVGAAASAAGDKSPLLGALLGALAAAAGTFVSYHLRVGTTERLNLPGTVVGAAEDLLVVGSGIGVVGRNGASGSGE